MVCYWQEFYEDSTGAACTASPSRAGRGEPLVFTHGSGPGEVEDREVYKQMEGIQRMMAEFTAGALDAAAMHKLLALQVFDSTLVTDELLAERVGLCEMQPKSVFGTMRVPNLTVRLWELPYPVLAFWATDDRFCPPSGALKLTTAWLCAS